MNISLYLVGNRSRKGFTLVELLVVMIIVSVLISFTTVRITQAIDSARIAEATALTENAFKSSLSYYTDRDEDYGDSSSLAASIAADGISAVGLNSITDDVPVGTAGIYVYGGGGNLHVQSLLPDGTISWVRHENGVISRGKGPKPANPAATLVTTGAMFACAVADGSGYCWGDNSQGQIGRAGGNAVRPEAVDDSGALSGKTITGIDAGNNHVCAVADGDAYCWGHGLLGELGDGFGASSQVPVAVSKAGVLAGTTVTDVAANITAGASCAVASGKAYCWGDDASGILGNGAGGASALPVAVDDSGVLSGRTITDITLGSSHACVVADGGAYCWGANGSGQLGTNDYAGATSPRAVDTSGVLAGRTVTAISAADSYTCAIADGAAFCWGGGGAALGDGSGLNSNIPVGVSTAGVLSGKTVTAIDTSNGPHTCAIADGEAFCWGYNNDGALGNASAAGSISSVPVAVSTAGVLNGLEVSAISTANSLSCAVADSETYCWGRNWFSQVGDATTTDRFVPVKVIQDSGVLGY